MMNRVVFFALASLLQIAVPLLPARNPQKVPQPRNERAQAVLKIQLTSVLVDDQQKALKFYTEILGFVKKRDIPIGKDRWLTVVSPSEPAGVELVLEPNGFPPAKTYQKALLEAGIPAAAFGVDDVQRTYEALTKMGVAFRTKPTKSDNAIIAVFDDTCGNLIQIFQVISK